MRLDYTVEPTEILTITTPLGTQHAIPIWRPIGERSKPVFLEPPPRPPMVKVSAPPKARKIPANLPEDWLYQRAAAYMLRNGNTGFTSRQVADALNIKREIGQLFYQYRDIFYGSDTRIMELRFKKSGAPINVSCRRWYVSESYPRKVKK